MMKQIVFPFDDDCIPEILPDYNEDEIPSFFVVEEDEEGEDDDC